MKLVREGLALDKVYCKYKQIEEDGELERLGRMFHLQLCSFVFFAVCDSATDIHLHSRTTEEVVTAAI